MLTIAIESMTVIKKALITIILESFALQDKPKKAVVKLKNRDSPGFL
jgi:hypothetical protein